MLVDIIRSDREVVVQDPARHVMEIRLGFTHTHDGGEISCSPSWEIIISCMSRYACLPYHIDQLLTKTCGSSLIFEGFELDDKQC